MLITGPRGRAVAKLLFGQEAAFYRHYAPLLRQANLGVLEVYSQTHHGILLEALDATLSPPYRDRRTDMTAYLARLHTIHPSQLLSSPNDPLPLRQVALSSQDILDASMVWHEEVRPSLVHLLQLPWPTVPSDRRLVSGDPNPTNWGGAN